jgi:hypothetical protein
LLTEPQVTRYSRQILLQEIGGVGQERILTARVALRGAGPAVEAAALYLSAAGVASVVADERAAWVVDGVAAGRAGAGLPCSDCLVAWFAARPRPPPPMIEAAALSAGAMASARSWQIARDLIAQQHAELAQQLAKRFGRETLVADQRELVLHQRVIDDGNAFHDRLLSIFKKPCRR